jgi:acyl carrier protein
MESTIARAWEKVLRIDRAGVDDNFFDLGGDSLQLIALHSELSQSLPVRVSMTDLFEYPTIRSLSKHICGSAGDSLAANAADDRARKQREAQERQRTMRRGACS